MNRAEIDMVFDGSRVAVCAEADTTDEEILSLYNRRNPARTPGGWFEIVQTQLLVLS